LGRIPVIALPVRGTLSAALPRWAKSAAGADTHVRTNEVSNIRVKIKDIVLIVLFIFMRVLYKKSA
jgi:hypothetical protein